MDYTPPLDTHTYTTKNIMMKPSASSVLLLILGSSGMVLGAPQPQQEFQVQKIQEVEPVSQEIVGVEQTEEEWAAEGRALSAEEYDKQVFIDMIETLFWDADEEEYIQDANTGRSHNFR